MNILKPLQAVYYKTAFECGLILSGVEEGMPQFIGSKKQFDKYHFILQINSL